MISHERKLIMKNHFMIIEKILGKNLCFFMWIIMISTLWSIILKARWFFITRFSITNNQWIIHLKNHDWSFWLFVIFKKSWFWLIHHDLMMKNHFEKSSTIMVGIFFDQKSWFLVDISWMIVNSHMINHVKKHKIISIEPINNDF